MQIKYSKPSADIQKENAVRIHSNHELYLKQARLSEHLMEGNKRSHCIVCAGELQGDALVHRKIPYRHCDHCGHIQTSVLSPKGYPESVDESMAFEHVYPKLDPKEYQSRKDRIYKPKLDWVIEVLESMGMPLETLRQKQWTDLGCGAGYFLSSLQELGITRVSGVDADKGLVTLASGIIGEHIAHHTRESLSQSMQRFPADIYTSFFVLEHVEDSFKVFKEMRKLPKGTVFVFSVPTAGLSMLLEEAFDKNYARCLDNVVHTQIYTEESIKYAMDSAGFEIVAQWVFGQDASSLLNPILSKLSKNIESSAVIQKLAAQLLELSDSLQQLVDQQHLSDQRHIIAIKS